MSTESRGILATNLPTEDDRKKEELDPTNLPPPGGFNFKLRWIFAKKHVHGILLRFTSSRKEGGLGNTGRFGLRKSEWVWGFFRRDPKSGGHGGRSEKVKGPISLARRIAWGVGSLLRAGT